VRDQFLTTLETAAAEEAKKLGAELTIYEAKEDIATQLSHIQTCAAQGFDAMIVNPVNATSGAEMIAAAGKMKVVFVNRSVHESLYVKGQDVLVGSDENVSGGLQGQFLAKYFNDKSKTSIDIVVLMGDLTHPAQPLRTNSALQGLKDGGITYNIVYQDTAGWSREIAMNKFVQFMGTGKNCDAVICNNDEMALGVIEAMKTAGTKEIFCPVVGIDATEVGCESVQAGEMAFTVFQNPVGQGAGAVDAAVALVKGESLANSNDAGTISWVPFEPVDINNVAEYLAK